jgi:chemotaxis protein methyltransferase CheR
MLNDILFLLKNQRGFDFSGYRTPMLERRVNKRMLATRCKSYDEYLDYLKNNADELDNLIDVFTINVSHFFRNSLTFEYLKKAILPAMIFSSHYSNNLRIWSAGCSFGEEPYSIAILLNELYEKEESNTNFTIFGTDLDAKAISRAQEGSYDYESIGNVKYSILNKYFTRKDEKFVISSEIKEKVHFSFYDLLNKNSLVPPESIYGNFDMVLCRNVLIYFNLEYQQIIFNKLHKSLNNNGYIVLGESETPIEQFKNKFKKVSNCCNVYQKIG